MEKNPKLIFFVEDDALMIRMYERLFKLSGFELIHAADGAVAIEQVQKLTIKPAIFVLDVMMPKLSGFDVLEFIKKNAELLDVPVIMLTNLATKEDAEKATTMGANLYLVKSQYGPKEIVQKIQTTIAGVKGA